MSRNTAETRRRSAALFGNEKVVEVVRALHAIPDPQIATAQQLSDASRIGHSMVRDVLQRLSNAQIVLVLPKVGGSRSAQYYQPVRGPAWDRLVQLCSAVDVPADLEPGRADG
jgi:ribosomal protein S25